MDYSKLKKPDHIKEHIWRQHLQWMEVVGKQAEENIKQQRQQRAADSHSQRAR